jgi:hypothetical protein
MMGNLAVTRVLPFIAFAVSHSTFPPISQSHNLTFLQLSIRWLLRGVYRVFFHPLSRFPGPKLSAFTRLPHLIAFSNGRTPFYVAQLHEKYGEVVRISSDELSFLNPQALRDIYGVGSKEGGGSAPPKNFKRYGTQVNGASPLITIQDPAEHARARKIFTTAFSDRALAAQEPLFKKYADQLVESLRKGAEEGVAFDMVRMYNFTTFDGSQVPCPACMRDKY